LDKVRGGINFIMKKSTWIGRVLILIILGNMLLAFQAFAEDRYYFDATEKAYWSGSKDGVAHWKKVDKAKKYEVLLYEGDFLKKRVYATGTKTDLTEYMENNMVYSFSVRAIPVDGQSKLRAGDWASSEELLVDWLGTTGGRWRVYSAGKKYQRSDQTYCANGWEKVQGDWYYFNPEGYVQVGWLFIDNQTYYLDGEGKRQTGWVLFKDPQEENWYYFDSSGVMQTGWVEWPLGQWYYLDTTGKMLSNTIVEGHQLDATGLMIN